MKEHTDIIALLVGGGLAIAGTVVSQVFGLLVGFLERRNKRRIVQRERFEELADCVAKTLEWFPKLSQCRSIAEFTNCQPPTDARRMVCLSILYFPELKIAVAEYSNGLARFYQWNVDWFNPKVPATIGAQSSMAPDAKEENHRIIVLRQKLDNAIEQAASKYAVA